jgi:hypothetical protein
LTGGFFTAFAENLGVLSYEKFEIGEVFGSKQNTVLTATEMNFPTFLKAAIITTP